MKTYKESWTNPRSFSATINKENYIFDVDHKYVFNIGDGSTGSTMKKVWIDHHIPYQKKEYKDYKIEEISAAEIDSYYKQHMIEHIFERWLER